MVFLLIMALALIVMIFKYYSLKDSFEKQVGQRTTADFEKWKNTFMKSAVSREAELLVQAINENAKNEIKSAKENARLEFQKWKMEESARIRQDAASRSTAVNLGKATEHLIPWFLGDDVDPREIRFLGSPIDLIVFQGLRSGYIKAVHFIEVKSGSRPKLSASEELVRAAIIDGRIAYSVVHLKNGGNGVAELEWLEKKQLNNQRKLMNEELRELMQKQSDALRSMEFEDAADCQRQINERIGMSVAGLSDQIAILRHELDAMKQQLR